MSLNTPEAAMEWLRETATAFMLSTINDIHLPGVTEPAFGAPLVACAAGNDPLWTQYKQHVGQFHWTPLEAFTLSYPQEKVLAEELRVVVWILPQTEATLADHRKETSWPAERWARSRIFGEAHVNQGLRRHLTEALRERGIQALSPMLLPEWSTMPSEAFVFSSTWSERHAAFAAGLGTFGLCDGLITPVGKAMRAGSLIVRMDLPVTPRPYTHHQEYCLYYSRGTCGVCMARCPAGAITAKGHNKTLCSDYVDATVPYVLEQFGFDGYGCGFCQVNVPCERRIPGRSGVQATRLP